MNSKQIRQKFFDFFENRGHKIVPSSSLMPADKSVLFTTAGMQQFSLYLSGEKDVLKDFGNRHLISCQKCFRSDDIEEVGDDTHNTFFEMLGNWSIGQDKNGKYFKEGTIKYTLEFLVNELGLDKDKFYATIFRGNKDIPRDKESEKIWLDNGIPKERIKEFSEEDNLWGPVGEIGVCGPNSEIHYDRGEKYGCGRKDCGPNCPYCKRVVEIWNHVFIQYYKKFKFSAHGESAESGQSSKSEKNEKILYEYILLPQGNIDTGMGFERVVAILQNKSSVYETDLFFPIIQEIEKLSLKKYNEDEKFFRIIADHLRGSCFLISEGILPSNLSQGYILRRLLRRIIRYAKTLNLPKNWYLDPIKKIMEIYSETYPEILLKENEIIKVIKDEEGKFRKALEKGLKEFKRDTVFINQIIEAVKNIKHIIKFINKNPFNENLSFIELEENTIKTYLVYEPFKNLFDYYNKNLKQFVSPLKPLNEKQYEKIKNNKEITSFIINETNNILKNICLNGKRAFHLFQTYSIPLEIIEEIVKEKGLKVDKKGFQKEFKKHQEISRAGAEKKFGGHGMKKSQIPNPKFQTNSKFKTNLKITKLHTATHLLHAALRQVLGDDVKQMGSDINEERLRFDFSYPQKMASEQIKKVEEIVNQKIEEDLPIKMEEMDYQKAIVSGVLAFFKEKYPEQVKVYSIGDFSKEICAGPHISHTGELGIFKIQKEKSSSAGVRRIKATLE